MNSKIITKAIAGMLAFILTFANVLLLGIYTQESIASSINLEEQETQIANANIEFDAYFEKDGEKVHTKGIDVTSNEEKLCLEIKVQDGYLSSGTVQVSNSNFRFLDDEQELKSIQNINEETSTVVLNQINKGESVVLKLPIVMNADSDFDIENLNKISSVALEGTYTTNNGENVSVSKTIEINAKMTANTTSNIETELRRYVPFNIGDESGVVLQIAIKSNIVDNILPVKEEKIEIEIPKINNIDPERVSLSAKSTKATNGKLERAFTQNVDYTYENGKVLLTVKNEKNESNIVSWEKDSNDEILLTCIYNENAIVETQDITLKANNSITVYDNEETVITANIEKDITLSEKVREIVTYSMETKNTPISKGYMLVEGAKNTPYTEAWTVNVANKDITDSILLDGVNGKEFYADESSNTYPAAVLYKSTKISRDNLVSMLGETGYINIYNVDGELISTLNKNKLEYTYTEEIANIKVEISKPVAEGIIKVEHERAIKSAEYSKAQTETFKKLRVSIVGRIVSGTQELFGTELTQHISLVEPITTIEASLNKTNLSTQEINEGMNLSIVLDTNDITNKLYKTPKVTIEFPSYIKEITNSQIELLYGQGLVLNVENVRQYTNTNGNIEIEMNISGEQTVFNTSSVSNGACVLVQGDIKVDELAPATSEKIKISILNDNENITNEIKVSYAAENKIIMNNSLSNYNESGEETNAIFENNIVTIEPSTQERTSKINIDIVNSKKETISDLIVLGRVPVTGNKIVTTSEDLESTFDANMTGRIIITGGVSTNDVEIYYSENEAATKNVEDIENGWTTNPQNLSNVKSYMIVFKEGTMIFGDKASFTYDVKIPANLTNGQKTYSTYAVFYKEGNTIKSEEAKKVGLMINGTIAPVNPDTSDISSEDLDIQISMSSAGKALAQNEAVKEGQYVDYTVTITNKTQNKNLAFDLEIGRENAKFYGLELYDYSLIGENTSESNIGDPLYKYNELEDETLAESVTLHPGQTYTYAYTLVVNSDASGRSLLSTVSIKQNNVKVMNDKVASNPISNGLVKINVSYNGAEKTKTYSEDLFLFIINVTNISGARLSNVNVSVDLPELLTYSEYYLYEQESNYDSVNVNGKHVSYTINSLSKDKIATIYVKTKTGSIDLSKNTTNVSLNANATVNGQIFTSNILNKQVNQSKTSVSARMTGNIDGEYVEDGQEIIYTVTIRNTGLLKETFLRIEDTLPKALIVEGYTVIDNEGNKTNYDTNYNVLSTQPTELNTGKSLTVKIKTKVNTYLADSEIINNFATVSGVWMNDVITNTVTYKIKDYDEIHNPDNPDTPQNVYSISGRVWKDNNLNGQRNLNEDALSGITVMLMDNKKAEFIKDNTGKDLITTTQIDGTYKFENLKEGEYVVIFKYDTNIYDVTTYRKDGISASENSDAINGTVRINGIDTQLAMTDIILVNGNIENIDLGLIQAKRFDLKLNKQINTVIVQNKEGTKSYTFEDKKTAKVEIPSKYMEGTALTIEYRISITNEGNVPGKVLKVIDYMPKDLDFSSEINNEWYKGTDGNLYTNEFENTVIEPGETKEVTLVLTKTLEEAASETINNYAEIQETYNILGLSDLDSIPGNNAQDEDDLSSADLIVTIKTGAVTYTLLILGTIVLIGIFSGGVYLIKKKVLTEKI